ncbi:hypothetical protein ALC57_13484 [Trachymyrmex cornetzi]|uniref:Uncharacterized protein n=1 Tax=Trachymyrmex cornetzi TaxID=471704 RepID=A0A195DNA8_9HYME|nr:hypothetical protein ALC57_13484 [Trachymyrmex cornetzi]
MESILRGWNLQLHQRRRQGPTDLRLYSLVRTFKELENRPERKERGRFFINNAAEFEMVTKAIASNTIVRNESIHAYF